MDPVRGIAQLTWRPWQRRYDLAALAATVVLAALRPRHWSRPVRQALARQVLFTGIESLGFVAHVAFWIGLSIVVQVQIWTGKIGHARLLGPLLVTLLVRELGPIMANLVVIGRSGAATALGLGHMKLAGEVRALDAQGVDPFLYLVMPRAIATVVSTFCLATVFILVALLSGYGFGVLIGAQASGLARFIDSIVAALRPVDVANFAVKATLPALLAACIACQEGLGAEELAVGVARSPSRATQRSVVALFGTSALISLLSYL